MVLPNGKYQGSPFWRGISWQFSVPVFEEEHHPIHLDKYSRLLQESFEIKMTNSNMHLNDILWYVPFLDLMSTNFKSVLYNAGLISPASKNSDLELGRVSFVLDSNEQHITRISMSLPIAILLFVAYYCSMYLIFWVIINGVAFFLNSCMTKYQLQL